MATGNKFADKIVWLSGVARGIGSGKTPPETRIKATMQMKPMLIISIVKTIGKHLTVWVSAGLPVLFLQLRQIFYLFFGG